MAEANLDRVKKGFELHNQVGPFGLMDYLIRQDLIHPDFLFQIQAELPTGGTYHGVDGYTRVTAEWREAWSSFEIEPKEFIAVDGDRILVVVQQHAVAKASGVEIDAEFFYVNLFEDGRLQQLHLYTDRAQAERAAGLGE